MDAGDLEPLLGAAETMVETLSLELLTATLSEKGIALVRAGDRFIAPAVAKQAFDVYGAADTVIAVLALCLACGLSPETGVQLANIAAGIVVGKVGTVPVEKFKLLTALAAVDAVAIFDESTPLDVIMAVRPDVIVKGGDYKLDTVFGAKEVQEWGGKVEIVPTVEGFSTTRLIEKGAGM